MRDTQESVERYYYELRKTMFDFDEVRLDTCHPPATTATTTTIYYGRCSLPSFLMWQLPNVAAS